MYRPLPEYLTIKSSEIDGFGLHAIEFIPKDTNIGISHHIIGDDYVRTPIGGFYNHSDNPNVVRVTENKICYLMTIRDIEAGEEITGKYNLYEVSNV